MFARVFVRVRSLRDVVVVTVHRLTVQGSCGPGELGFAAGLSKFSQALLKFPPSGADALLLLVKLLCLRAG